MGSEARARLALFAVGIATLLTFNQLFGQQEFAGPSLLGMMAATAIALGCRRLGLSGSVTLIASALGLVWYVSLIFQAPHTFWGLPTLEALTRIGRAVGRAYEHSNIDYAPVPLRTGYAILTVMAMWVLIALGEVATFRWRRPLVASLPPVALFSFILVVGTRQGATVNVILFLAAIFTFWSLEANHRLRSWGRWVPVWKGRQDEEPASITTSLARRMGVACVSAALVLPVFLPTLEDGLVSWRNKTGEGGLGGSGPFIGSGNVDPLVSLVPQLITQTEEELFIVDSTEPSYWRLYTLNRFDGENWTDGSPVTENVGSNGTVPMLTPDPRPGRSLTARFTVSGLRSVGLPLVGSPITVAPDSPVPLTVDPITGDVKYEGGVEEGFAYNVISMVPEATFRVLRDTPVGGASSDIYFETGAPLSPDVRQLVEDWTADARTPFQELRALQDRLRGFNYSLDVDQPMSADYLEEFLLETRTGYCQQFATAFAVLARHLGYPARVQVGFLPGSTDVAEPNRYRVNGSDTHAWPEVHFEGLGWIPFEPTPRDGTAPPDYTIRAVPGSVPANPAAADNVFTGGQNKRGFEDIGGVRDNPRGITDGRPDAAVPGANRRTRIDGRWVQTFTRILIALLAMALAFVASVPMIKRWRIRRRYTRAADARGRAAAAFAEFQQEAAELASPRKRAESAAAYARRIGNSITPARSAAVRLASIYELAEFGPSELSPQLADEARRLARTLKAKLWAQATWWRRAKRVLSPAGLVKLPELGFRRVALQKLVSLSRS